MDLGERRIGIGDIVNCAGVEFALRRICQLLLLHACAVDGERFYRKAQRRKTCNPNLPTLEPNMIDLPVAWANYISMGIFIFLGCLVWIVPKKAILADQPETDRWRDLRIWAMVLIALQLGIYWVFS